MRKLFHLLSFLGVLLTSIIPTAKIYAQSEFLPQILVFDSVCDQATGGYGQRVELKRPANWLPKVPRKPYCEAIFKFEIDDAKKHIVENPALTASFIEAWTHFSEDLLRIAKGEQPLKENQYCYFAEFVPTDYTDACGHIERNVEQWKAGCGI